MLFDLFTALTTRCSPYIRHLGYVNETLAMRGRYDKRKSAWHPHLHKTREFVLSCARQCRERNRVLIMGSGLLLDLPLDQLAELFEEVVLVDLVCLPGIRRQLNKHARVSFVERDVTGVSEQLYRNRLRGIGELPVAEPLQNSRSGADLVISLNILSQLWVVPRAYILNHGPGTDPDQLDEWCARMVADHFAFLRSRSCPVCLVADYEFVKRNRNGGIMSRGSTVFDLALPEPDQEWNWKIAPMDTESNFYSKELAVGAWYFS